MVTNFKIHSLTLAVLLVFSAMVPAQNTRTVSGTVVTPQFELVPGVTVEVRSSAGVVTVVSDGEGKFSARVAEGPLFLTFSGKTSRRWSVGFQPPIKPKVSR